MFSPDDRYVDIFLARQTVSFRDTWNHLPYFCEDFSSLWKIINAVMPSLCSSQLKIFIINKEDGSLNHLI